jgi:hypothetical protein
VRFSRTGEAFEYLLDAVDVHTRAVVIVEGTQADHLPAFFLKAYVLAYYVNDVTGLLNL